MPRGAFSIAPVIAGWKLPLNLAILFHVLILSSAIILPKYFDKKVIIPEFLSVDLVSLPAPSPPPVSKQMAPAPPPPAKPIASATKPKPVVAKKTAPIAPIVAEKVVSAPVKAISIKPIKRKIKKKIVPDTRAADAKRAREQRARKQQQALLQKKRQQLLQDAQRKNALAAAEEKAASAAVKALRQMLLANAAMDATTGAGSAPVKKSSGANSVIENQFIASISGILQEHWALPDIKPWNPDLTAVVVINIAKNGRIVSHRFEKRSGDRVFDQFVSRAIQDSNPLPAIPGAMRVQQYSIGFNFKPGRIQ